MKAHPKRIKAGSILRMCEYQELSQLTVEGNVLDLGGSTVSTYQTFFSASHIDTFNIDPNVGANIIGSVEEKFPVESETYDNVLAINLIEHVYKVSNVFTETFRVLKPGGKFIIVVPFFHHIHGSPDDYHRYTASCLRRMCSDAGLSEISIKELGGGLFSTWFQMVGGKIRPIFLRDLFKDLSHGLDSFLAEHIQAFDKLRKNNPLGYLVVAEKPTGVLTQS